MCVRLINDISICLICYSHEGVIKMFRFGSYYPDINNLDVDSFYCKKDNYGPDENNLIKDFLKHDENGVML